MSEVTLTGFGPLSWLVHSQRVMESGAGGGWSGWERRLEQDPPQGLVEWIPAFGSMLLRFGRRRPDEGAMQEWLAAGTGGVGELEVGRTVEIPVRYDGADLGEVAERLGMEVGEVVRRHVAGRYRVQCLGFSPGFPYLTGLDPGLQVPRRDSPRARVAAGSVAIGGQHAGIYTVPSPGGWNLLGTTTRRIFDPWAERMEDRFLLRAGDAVRCVETSEEPTEVELPNWGSAEEPWLGVISAGGLLGIQDGGRPGWGRYGVPAGGAMDPMALHWANRLVGNPEEVPAMELAGGGQAFKALVPVTIGVAGADAQAEVHSPDGQVRGVRCWSTETLSPGEVLLFRGSRSGVWTYVALRGGVVVPLVLGSASFNARAGLGVVPQVGDTVAGRDPEPAIAGATRSRWVDPARLPGREPERVRVWPGPQADRFDEMTLRQFFRSVWRVSSRSDRVGYRLDGPSLPVPGGSMISEPVLPGSVQVPPNGRPIVTMPDGPTVGGYPKLGLVDPRDLWRVAQTPADSVVQWVPEGWD